MGSGHPYYICRAPSFGVHRIALNASTTEAPQRVLRLLEQHHGFLVAEDYDAVPFDAPNGHLAIGSVRNEDPDRLRRDGWTVVHMMHYCEMGDSACNGVEVAPGDYVINADNLPMLDYSLDGVLMAIEDDWRQAQEAGA